MAKKIRELSYDQMIELRKQGVTLREIGERLGISRERVRQVIGNTKDITPKKIILTKEEKRAIQDRIRIDKFWNQVDRLHPHDCWNWTGHCNPVTGYGYFSNRKYMSSHRMAYELTYGKIPEGMCILHSCDNPKCCNPAHLRVGTQQDNVDDREERNYKRRNGSNAFYKSRNESMFADFRDGMDIGCLSRKYVISRQMVYVIIRRFEQAIPVNWPVSVEAEAH
jgi:hypothetical protein